MTAAFDLVTRDDLIIHQGDDRPVVWTLTAADGSPADLNGYTARAQVRERPESTTVLHEWSTATNTVELANSTVSLKVTDSESWTWTRGVYDLTITDFAGRTEVVARGSVVVIPGVTR